jgi:hypothetical protein
LSLESISIPSSVATISKCCFKCCEKLSNLTFESGSAVLVVGEFAFQKCSSLKSDCLPPGIETVAKCAVNDCHGARKLLNTRTQSRGEILFTESERARIRQSQKEKGKKRRQTNS